MKLDGIVTSGFKEGSKYVKIYKEKIKEVLKITPFEGTLNIKIPIEVKKLKIKDGIKIDGFGEYGSIILFRCKINNIPAYIVIPEKSKHRDVIEVISDLPLRDILNLKDGDKIYLEFWKLS